MASIVAPTRNRFRHVVYSASCIGSQLAQYSTSCQRQSLERLHTRSQQRNRTRQKSVTTTVQHGTSQLPVRSSSGMRFSKPDDLVLVELKLWHSLGLQHQASRQHFGASPLTPSGRKHDSYQIFSTFSNGYICANKFPITPSTVLKHSVVLSDNLLHSSDWRWSEQITSDEVYQPAGKVHLEPQLGIRDLGLGRKRHFQKHKTGGKLIGAISGQNKIFKRRLKNQVRIFAKSEQRTITIGKDGTSNKKSSDLKQNYNNNNLLVSDAVFRTLMPSELPSANTPVSASTPPAKHKPLVVGLRKPQSTETMTSSKDAAALNKEINENVKENTAAAAPAEEATAASSETPADQPKKKKEKAPKQPKATPPVAPTSPALIDLRVGHILRAIAHPNADSLYVSTIAMGDSEGTENTVVDEETGKVVRTVCSGLRAYIPLEEMQNRKIIVVANLKPVNMRSIKSAAMVLAASPKQEEGADPHAPDRLVELVIPPEGSEAGDKVYFEGWPYGEGRGPEKVLNPKKKQWEAIQPGFYTSEDLVVGFDASVCEEVQGIDKGDLIVEGKGRCMVRTLKGAVVR